MNNNKDDKTFGKSDHQVMFVSSQTPMEFSKPKESIFQLTTVSSHAVIKTHRCKRKLHLPKIHKKYLKDQRSCYQLQAKVQCKLPLISTSAFSLRKSFLPRKIRTSSTISFLPNLSLPPPLPPSSITDHIAWSEPLLSVRKLSTDHSTAAVISTMDDIKKEINNRKRINQGSHENCPFHSIAKKNNLSPIHLSTLLIEGPFHTSFTSSLYKSNSEILLTNNNHTLSSTSSLMIAKNRKPTLSLTDLNSLPYQHATPLKRSCYMKGYSSSLTDLNYIKHTKKQYMEYSYNIVDTPLQFTSSKLTASKDAGQMLRRRKKIIEREPKINPYPDLVIMGCQCEIQNQLSSVMSDLIDTALYQVGEMIQETENNIKRLQNRKSWIPDLPSLLEESEEEILFALTDESLSDNEVVFYKDANGKLRVATLDNYQLTSSELEAIRTGTMTQREIIEKRLMQQRVEIFTREEIKVILERATGDPKQKKKIMKLLKNKAKRRKTGDTKWDSSDDSEGESGREDLSRRKRKKRKKKKKKNHQMDGEETEDEEIYEKGDRKHKKKKRNKHGKERDKEESDNDSRRHKKKDRKKRHKKGKNNEHEEEETSERETNDKIKKRKKDKKRKKHKKGRDYNSTESDRAEGKDGEKKHRKKKEKKKRRKDRRHKDADSADNEEDGQSGDERERQYKKRKEKKKRKKEKAKRRHKRQAADGDDGDSSDSSSNSNEERQQTKGRKRRKAYKQRRKDRKRIGNLSSTEISSEDSSFDSSDSSSTDSTISDSSFDSSDSTTDSSSYSDSSYSDSNTDSAYSDSSSDSSNDSSRDSSTDLSSFSIDSATGSKVYHKKKKKTKKALRKKKASRKHKRRLTDSDSSDSDSSSDEQGESGEGVKRSKKKKKHDKKKHSKKESTRRKRKKEKRQKRKEGQIVSSSATSTSSLSSDEDHNKKKKKKKKKRKRRKGHESLDSSLSSDDGQSKKKKRNKKAKKNRNYVDSSELSTSRDSSVNAHLAADKIQLRTAQMIAEKTERALKRDGTFTEYEEEERETRNRNIEASVAQNIEQKMAEIANKRQREREMKRKAEIEYKERERRELERQMTMYQRKEAKNQETIKRLEQLKKEVADKQLMYTYKESVMGEYFKTIEAWNEQDYSYLEYYCGKEYMQNIREIEKQKQIEEAIKAEQLLMESLEIKRRELLMKLEQVHGQYLTSFKDSEMSLELYARISHSFVFSYFDCSPDLKLASISNKI